MKVSKKYLKKLSFIVEFFLKKILWINNSFLIITTNLKNIRKNLLVIFKKIIFSEHWTLKKIWYHEKEDIEIIIKIIGKRQFVLKAVPPHRLTLRAGIRLEGQSSSVHGVCLAASTWEKCYVSFKLTKKLQLGELSSLAS